MPPAGASSVPAGRRAGPRRSRDRSAARRRDGLQVHPVLGPPEGQLEHAEVLARQEREHVTAVARRGGGPPAPRSVDTARPTTGTRRPGRGWWRAGSGHPLPAHRGPASGLRCTSSGASASSTRPAVDVEEDVIVDAIVPRGCGRCRRARARPTDGVRDAGPIEVIVHPDDELGEACHRPCTTAWATSSTPASTCSRTSMGESTVTNGRSSGSASRSSSHWSSTGGGTPSTRPPPTARSW